MSWRETPVFIVNRNNLDRGFRRLHTWLIRAGMENVTVIDNGSTWGPLLQYYEEARVLVLRFDENRGPYALWETGSLSEGRFVVTDADVVPDAACPFDLVRKCFEVMDRTGAVKVGPSLRIDDLPDCYALRERVLEWEAQFQQPIVPEGDAVVADIDTTFALYEAGARYDTAGLRLRLTSPYVAQHLPWYEDSSVAHQERNFYHAHVRKEWIHW